MPVNDFAGLGLSPDFLANLASLKYHDMTPVQARTLPLVLAGKDVKAQAKTGSGKTAAFGIGLLHGMKARPFQTRALILCPTRELADQVSKELRRLARPIDNIKIPSICGGVGFGPQLASLEHPPHVVVGTPGRILKHLAKGSLKIGNISTLVLDEADRMLDMGFLDDIRKIISHTPDARQTLLFSATYPKEIEQISKSIQRSPELVEVESQHEEQVIRQLFYKVERHDKPEALVQVLAQHQPASTVVFCNRKQQSQEVCDALRDQGVKALALHGDLEQKDRDRILVQFSNKSASVLVATDVAARGLDIQDLDLVINYELSADPEVYVHRIGRTGRAGNEGLAISLVAGSEHKKLVNIEYYQKRPAGLEELPVRSASEQFKLKPPMVTLCIQSGRKNKMRPGDILGALTAGEQLSGADIGKIDIFDFISYVAVKQDVWKTALNLLSGGKIKGQQHRVRRA